MSKISADNLSNKDDTKEIPVETVVAGSAKVWVNFNGSGTIAIRDSFNVSSLTDNGTGQYTVNFTNEMANVNYAPVVGGEIFHVTPRDLLVGSVNIESSSSAHALTDYSMNSVAIFANN
jgi:hypothetical protein